MRIKLKTTIMERTIENLVIERYVTPNFKSLLLITPSNKNYEVLFKINTILENNNKTFIWLLEGLDVWFLSLVSNAIVSFAITSSLLSKLSL